MPPPGEEFFGGLQNRFERRRHQPVLPRGGRRDRLRHRGRDDLRHLPRRPARGPRHPALALGDRHPQRPGPGPGAAPRQDAGDLQLGAAWRPTARTATLNDATGAEPRVHPGRAGHLPGHRDRPRRHQRAGDPVDRRRHLGGRDHRPGRRRAARRRHRLHATATAPRHGDRPFTAVGALGPRRDLHPERQHPAGHYSEGCVSCHTVGLRPGGGQRRHRRRSPTARRSSPRACSRTARPTTGPSILAEFPATAKLANIQCENCHGPQDSGAHGQQNGSRTTLSSDLCGTCHGEPPAPRPLPAVAALRPRQLRAGRRGRHQRDLRQVPQRQRLRRVGGERLRDAANLNVTWTADEVHPQTCQTCHDPHDVGTTSGSSATNATVRIVRRHADARLAGFTATNVGKRRHLHDLPQQPPRPAQRHAPSRSPTPRGRRTSAPRPTS